MNQTRNGKRECHDTWQNYPTPAEFAIVEGREYIYIREKPAGCQGQRYRVLKFVVSVPSYQEQVLVEALTGWDKGLWFTCSPANFASRYVPAEG